MKLSRFIATSLAAGAILTASVALVAAQTEIPSDSSHTQSDSMGSGGVFSAQPSGPSAAPGVRGQNQDDQDHALEIAPQTGLIPHDKGAAEIPSDKAYQPQEDTSSLDRNFNPGGEATGEQHHKLPYLGIEVQYALKCYLGAEEHGLEIVKVDPNSPAWQSGLNGRKGMSAVGAAAVTAGALVGPLELLVQPLLARAGQLGVDGDLIVAIDDHRVRSQFDLEDQLSRLKPGDTMYLTVIRPLPGGAHKTMKVAVKVGEPNENLAGGSSNPVPPTSGAEQYAY